MSIDDTQVNSDAADQNEGEGEDLDTNTDTDTGADDVQDTGDDTAGEGSADGDADAGAESGFEAKFKDQQKRSTKLEGFLKAAGLDPKTGKPKENKRAPNKDANVPSQEDGERFARLEERTERAELRSIGITHADDIKLVRDAAKRLGIEATEAAADEFVKSKLERQQAVRKIKDNTPPPTKGGGPTPKKGKDAWDMTDEEFQKERTRVMSGN